MEKLHGEQTAMEVNGGSRETLIDFIGSFDEGLVHDLSERLEQKLLGREEKKTIVKRSFVILIEALQNTKLHSERDEAGAKLLALGVSSSDNDLRIRFLNLTTEEKVAEVQRRISLLNEMDPVELKKYYLDVMTNGERSSKGGAGLGLITMVMKSKNPLDLNVFYADDGVCILTTTVTIDRPSG